MTWQLIETAKTMRVLGWAPQWDGPAIVWRGGDGWYEQGWGLCTIQPTHWMPLPAPPIDTGTETG